MQSHCYGIEIPLADGYTMYELVRCESPEKAAEVVRMLLSCLVSSPARLQIVVHPASVAEGTLKVTT
jgi:hypothetical protein